MKTIVLALTALFITLSSAKAFEVYQNWPEAANATKPTDENLRFTFVHKDEDPQDAVERKSGQGVRVNRTAASILHQGMPSQFDGRVVAFHVAAESKETADVEKNPTPYVDPEQTPVEEPRETPAAPAPAPQQAKSKVFSFFNNFLSGVQVHLSPAAYVEPGYAQVYSRSAIYRSEPVVRNIRPVYQPTVRTVRPYCPPVRVARPYCPPPRPYCPPAPRPTCRPDRPGHSAPRGDSRSVSSANSRSSAKVNFKVIDRRGSSEPRTSTRQVASSQGRPAFAKGSRARDPGR